MKSIKSPEFSTNYPTPDSSIQYLFDEQIDVDLSCPKCTNPRTSDRWCNHCESKWDLQARTPVALKSLYNSKDWTEDFLNELQAHYKFRNGRVLHCYGVTQDKVSSNYMLVMEFANGGDLRHYLNRNNSLLSWGQKLLILKEIALDRDLAAEHLSTGNIDSGFSQTSHPEAIFASRLLNFSNLPDSGDVLDISEYSIYFCDGEQVEDEANKENDYITRAYDDSLSNHL
ncbi:17735_t:CDS:2 [Funneliformis caledonium]|uniref:17735_t:CDS:1 n=1 Tax=Funneliformis caledonium TaxID=1117310 RepID=A0A9N8ZWX6_9GLOM|nr:17735_t:CDS:2 [Funneliformis caledonium]